MPGQVDGRISVTAAFDYTPANNTETIEILTYNGASRYTRPAANINVIEPALRAVLMSAVSYLDKWTDRYADTNPVLARGFEISFHDVQKNDADTLCYSAARPLTFDDFKAPEPHAAATYAGQVLPLFAYDEHVETYGGVIHLDIGLKVWLARSDSWVRSNARNATRLITSSDILIL